MVCGWVVLLPVQAVSKDFVTILPRTRRGVLIHRDTDSAFLFPLLGQKAGWLGAVGNVFPPVGQGREGSLASCHRVK